MSDAPVQEQAPTRDELEREARRLERSRHLTLVAGTAPDQAPAQLPALRDRDPDPKAAA